MAIKVSVIIPAFNEAGTIKGVLDNIKEALKDKFTFEIIVVDDGSSDATAEICRREGVRVLREEVNSGYGSSLKKGIRIAGGEIIALIDADGTYGAEDLVNLLNKLEDFDMVVGARIGEKARLSPLRRIPKYFLKRLASLLTGTAIPDVNSGLRVVTKDIVLKYMSLFPQGFSFTTTLTLAMLCDGYRVRFIPITFSDRKHGSKIRPIRDTLGFIITVLRTILYFNPLKIFMPLSLVIFIMASGRLFQDIFIRDNIGDMAVILFIAFFQVFLLGVIADIAGRRR